MFTFQKRKTFSLNCISNFEHAHGLTKQFILYHDLDADTWYALFYLAKQMSMQDCMMIFAYHTDSLFSTSIKLEMLFQRHENGYSDIQTKFYWDTFLKFIWQNSIMNM